VYLQDVLRYNRMRLVSCDVYQFVATHISNDHDVLNTKYSGKTNPLSPGSHNSKGRGITEAQVSVCRQVTGLTHSGL
jgi:hypothetical protein